MTKFYNNWLVDSVSSMDNYNSEQLDGVSSMDTLKG